MKDSRPEGFPFPKWKTLADAFDQITDWIAPGRPYAADQTIEVKETPTGRAMRAILPPATETLGCDLYWTAPGDNVFPDFEINLCFQPYGFWKFARAHGGIDPSKGIEFYVGDCPNADDGAEQEPANHVFPWPTDAVKQLLPGETYTVNSDALGNSMDLLIAVEEAAGASWTLTATVSGGGYAAGFSTQTLHIEGDGAPWSADVVNNGAGEIFIGTPQCVVIPNESLGAPEGHVRWCPRDTAPKVCVVFRGKDGAEIKRCELYAPECPEICVMEYVVSAGGTLMLCDDPTCVSASETSGSQFSPGIFRGGSPIDPDDPQVERISVTVSNIGPGCLLISYPKCCEEGDFGDVIKFLTPREVATYDTVSHDTVDFFNILSVGTCQRCECLFTIAPADGIAGAIPDFAGLIYLGAGSESITISVDGTFRNYGTRSIAVSATVSGIPTTVLVAPNDSLSLSVAGIDDGVVTVDCTTGWAIHDLSGNPTTDRIPSGTRDDTITIHGNGGPFKVRVQNTGAIPLTANGEPVAPGAFSAEMSSEGADLVITIVFI